jgi:hypothetical protein
VELLHCTRVKILIFRPNQKNQTIELKKVEREEGNGFEASQLLLLSPTQFYC